ncbi:MAG: tRNA pseudouridine(38-40) synthase TruA [Gammaproteobacteria bacterium]|nr:tRNA pseudouridine(38-40) synthase TruA [Gammaproteobacteria bacterium]
MQRIALGVEYNGINYHGWQRQPENFATTSVQAVLEGQLRQIANEKITVYCAGRTDSGVHATEQVVHFDYFNQNNKPRDLRAWLQGTNSLLPDDISLTWAQYVPNDFHARFSALSRRYQYYIYSSKYSRALLEKRALWLYKNLNIELMQQACKYLIGEHDFSSFRSSQCQAKTSVRIMRDIKISMLNNFIVIDLTANAFLHHMVRNIVSCLIEIGSNKKSAEWIKELLEIKDRTKAPKTIASHGLYLVNVEYDAKFNLPNLTNEIILPFMA